MKFIVIDRNVAEGFWESLPLYYYKKTPDNEILVRNVINRTEEEFLRLSIENKKNNKLNMISIAIGIMGIAVSVLTALTTF